VPVAVVVLLTGADSVFTDQSLFFSGAALLFAAAFWCELTPGKALPTSLGRMALRYWAVAMILLSAAGAVSAVTHRGL